MPTRRLGDATLVPALGQGTWYMGERRGEAEAEIAALRLGLDLGMTLIDTAEMYAEGGAERIVGKAIAGRRAEVFLVSKVYPHNASRQGVVAAAERSLKRLGVERIDLYLLHWPGSHPLGETIAGFQALIAAGKIARWGVSNFDPAGLARVMAAARAAGSACMTDQVLYHPQARGIEFDLLPLCAEHRMAVMAYSPLGQAGALLRSPALGAVARRHGVSAAQVALAFALRHPHVIAIPKAVHPDHIRANAAAASLRLTPADLAEIDAAHPPPDRAEPLEML
ncbi:MAG: aldo/keto reductase [Rhodospirillales bacterium]|nr:aldo/keto reductase [Rhodospirillales bacterium]